ncbi:M1 family metallopeptidase [Cryomorpha ignava]|uniref:M1 family metallopeptidase n=1 Tax=Cryomorpha ignava TaxID=101383 RepID=A0A7K3WTB6_9FLAO|nr:M1 family metallopeptidase [Cryomorpha ignava]NEN23905.1 M1 family metallopeptidase [Cryomorpha ignava]
MKQRILLFIFLGALVQVNAQKNYNTNKFKQLNEELPTPNVYRTASGAPGAQYWQQRADYQIEVKLDEDAQTISGNETITYYNNSPDKLTYLWVQLDQNVRATTSDSYKIRQNSIGDSISFDELKNLVPWFDGGFKIEKVTDTKGTDLPYVINKTMMRIDLAQPLVPNGAYSFKVKWNYNINNRDEVGGRSGYEYFEDENNSIYTIAQFYPRMAVYSDVQGWQNKQFLGRGEFTVPFGNFDVKITVPADHVVAATGELQNSSNNLTPTQIDRFNKAKTADKPTLIITEEEARQNEKGRSADLKTWHFKAENVRDYGWASSRKFIWDAQGMKFGDRTVMGMSYYPKEGNPLWGRYSTEAVLQTLETYSRHTFDYPYPVAISVNSKSIGMEYPMICFNFGRSEPDGTYTERMKYGMIGVIIHEVGHNYFPMIVNSDERQWTWMDEGLNTFLQYLTEQDFERGYPSRRGEPRNIVGYMKGDKASISPIMTNSESIHQFGNNAYGKPATALNILRETVMGRDLFDFAFKTYAQRWMFKHPTPADFFRSMEDASAVDLDWFWRGWFYTTDHVDISIDEVKWLKVAENLPGTTKGIDREKRDGEAKSISDIRNNESGYKTRTERDSTLIDFYSNYDPYKKTPYDDVRFSKQTKGYTDQEIAALSDVRNFYQISFSNIGGLVMPIIVQFTFEDGSTEIHDIPAEIWKMGDETVTKVFVTEKEVTNVLLDPYQQTADVNVDNNTWPARHQLTRFELYKSKRMKSTNPMQRARGAEMEKPIED